MRGLARGDGNALVSHAGGGCSIGRAHRSDSRNAAVRVIRRVAQKCRRTAGFDSSEAARLPGYAAASTGGASEGCARPAAAPLGFRTARGSVMAMLSNLDLIRRVPLFSMLTNEQAQGIADSVVKRRMRRGELVIEAGRKSNALFILYRPCPRDRGRCARTRSHPGGAAGGRLCRRDEPDRQRAALGDGSHRSAVRHAGARPGRIRALPAGKFEPVVRDHAGPGAASAQRRPADRIARTARCLWPGRPQPARHGRNGRRPEGDPQQGFAPGPGEDRRRIARNGQPRDEGPRGARHDPIPARTARSSSPVPPDVV